MLTFNTKYGLFVLMHSIQVTKVTFFNVRALVFHSMVMSLIPLFFNPFSFSKNMFLINRRKKMNCHDVIIISPWS